MAGVKRSHHPLLGGYEQRVRFFLGLLVFVLAAANTANFLLLRRSSDLARDSVEEAVDLRGTMAARALLAGSPPDGLLPADLQRIAEASGLRGLSLLDATGRVIVAGDSSPRGTLDLDFPRGLVLTPPSSLGLSFRPSRRIVDRGAVMVRFEAVTASAPRGAAPAGPDRVAVLVV